jgi:hypothetical protein
MLPLIRYSLVSLCHANMLLIDEIHEPDVGLYAESAEGFEAMYHRTPYLYPEIRYSLSLLWLAKKSFQPNLSFSYLILPRCYRVACQRSLNGLTWSSRY